MSATSRYRDAHITPSSKRAHGFLMPLAYAGSVSTTRIPVYIPVCRVTGLPADYAVNDRTKFSFANMKESAWWAFDFMDNLVNRRYQDMIKDLRAVRDPFGRAVRAAACHREERSGDL